MKQERFHHLSLSILLLGILTLALPTQLHAQDPFNRGDCNTDNLLNIADAILGLGILFSGAGPANCDDACDINDDGSVDIGDPITLLANLFSSGPNPPPPSNCGDDPTPDSLDCQTGPSGCTSAAEDCSNGVDDDGDSDIDCADSDCVGDPACVETDCDNGTDDDGDGAADCADSDCAGDPSCTAAASFEFDIYPLIDMECNFCHGPPANFGNLDMTTGGASGAYARIVDVASSECSNYDLIEPNDSQTSWLMRKIEGTHVDAANAVGCDPISAGAQMPLAAFCCLEPFEIDAIRNWIDSGAAP